MNSAKTVSALLPRGRSNGVDNSRPGVRVVHFLERLAETRGLPREIVLENGPKTIGKAANVWVCREALRLPSIDHDNQQSGSCKVAQRSIDLDQWLSRWTVPLFEHPDLSPGKRRVFGQTYRGNGSLQLVN